MIKHYLLTVPILPHANMHCYLVTPDDKFTMPAVNKMMQLCEEHKLSTLPAVLITPLDNDTDFIQKLIARRFPDTLQYTTQKSYINIFILTNDEDDDKKLMEYH